MQATAVSSDCSKERNSGPSSSQRASSLCRGFLARAAEKSGTRNGLASCREITDCGTTRRSVSGRSTGSAAGGSSSTTSMPAARLQVADQLAGGVGDHRVLAEQLEQGRVAGGRLRQDRGDAVEPLELLAAPRLGQLGVGLDPGPLLARQQRDDLELGAHRGRDRAALDGGLDLAHGAGELRDQPTVVLIAGATAVVARCIVAGRSAAAALGALTRSCQGTSPFSGTRRPVLEGRCDVGRFTRPERRPGSLGWCRIRRSVRWGVSARFGSGS